MTETAEQAHTQRLSDTQGPHMVRIQIARIGLGKSLRKQTAAIANSQQGTESLLQTIILF